MFGLIAELVLLGSALGSTWLLYRRAETDARPTTLLVMSLGALSLALASLGRLTLTTGSTDQQTLQLMLDNLAQFAGLPLLALAVPVRAWALDWSRAAWGRWLLGFFALFELFRRFGIGELYGQGLAVAICLALLAGVLKGYRGTALATGLVAVVMAGAALLVLGPTALVAGYGQEALYRPALGAFLLFLSFGVRRRRDTGG